MKRKEKPTLRCRVGGLAFVGEFEVFVVGSCFDVNMLETTGWGPNGNNFFDDADE